MIIAIQDENGVSLENKIEELTTKQHFSSAEKSYQDNF